ncbi:MAG: D-glucuronyl C5-epimerase family protein [Actinomycetota bacterium]
MLYYYKIRKRQRLQARKWFIISFISVLVWAYFYPGSFADVVPELDRRSLPSLPTNIFPTDRPIEHKKVKVKTPSSSTSPDKSISIEEVRRVESELNRQGKSKEASELAYSLDLLERIEKDGPIAKTRIKAIKRDLAETVAYFKAGNSASNRMKILDDKGSNLAYVYYPNYGVHFNPVTTANLAIDEYKKGNYERFTKIVDNLLDIAVVKEYPGVGKFCIWENYYDLEFGTLKFPAPWPSGMAQGLILDIVGKSYKLTGNRKYLEAGEFIINSFKVPWYEGGVTDTDEHGNWYLEVAATNKLRILNGFLFTLQSIYNYYEQTKSPKALALFNAGTKEARMHIKDYDLGYWSNYSLISGNLASYNYHKIHVDLLWKLYTITGIQEFKTYAERFDFYLKYRFINIPPTHPSFKVITSLAEKGIIISKDGWFSSHANISRAEFIGWLARALGWKPSAVYKGYYPDVDQNCEDWNYIETAFEKGLKFSNEGGLFRPQDSISRAEMASILCTAVRLPGDRPAPQVADIPNNSQSYNNIKLVLANGLMEPYEPNYFRPDIKVTKEQAAITLFKLLEAKNSR